MFGYVAANLKDLSTEEQLRYRAAYCGLCRSLGMRYGQRSRPTLTYDLTFLALLLGSLNEPEEEQGTLRCALHPLKTQAYVHTCYTEYAADLSAVLAYYKCLDDWHDDHSLPARAYAAALNTAYRSAAARIPRQSAAIEQGLADISRIEGSSSASPDDAAKRFGEILGELFIYEQDIWAESLREFGSWLGRLVYFMDAACDLERDRRRGSYNPLASLELSEQEIDEMLMLFAARATRIFEKLPLEKDLHLLRSVLYSGIWQKRQAQQARHAKRQAKERAGQQKLKEDNSSINAATSLASKAAIKDTAPMSGEVMQALEKDRQGARKSL